MSGSISNTTNGGPTLAGCRVVAIISGIELFGHEKGNIEALKAIRDAGATVKVGVNCLKNGGAVREALIELGFDVFIVPLGYQWSKQFFRDHPTLVFTNMWRVVRSSWVLRQVCREFKPTHVHIATPLVYSYLAPALWWSGVPLVYRSGDKAPLRSAPINRFIWNRCLRRANAIVTISDFVQRNMLQVAPSLREKIVTIYNRAPETVNDGSVVPDNDGLRHIVYVGQIAEHKGVSLLVDVAKEVVARYPDVVFDFLGGSQYSKEYEEGLRARVGEWGLTDRLRFHGSIKNPIPFLKSCILHVAPSVFEEPLGNVVLEAKLAGIPSVVFPSGGLPEMIDDRVDGYVCDSKSVESLKDGITYFLDDEDRRLECARAASAGLVIRFGDARFIDEWTRVYNSVRNGH